MAPDEPRDGACAPADDIGSPEGDDGGADASANAASRLARARAALAAALAEQGVGPAPDAGFVVGGFGEAPQAAFGAGPATSDTGPSDTGPSLPAPRRRRPRPASLGADVLDTALGGGLGRGTIHEVMARDAGDLGAAHGFSLALAVRLAGPAARKGAGRGNGAGRVLVVQDEAASREDGDLYGPGLALHGLDPARLLIVRAPTTRDALWATEQALRCRALAAVVAELSRIEGVYDLTASRRLVLAAREGGTTGLLVRAAFGARGTALASAAETRWIVAAAPSRPGLAGEPGLPAWRVSLARHRGGREGLFHLEWSHDDRAFRHRDGDPHAERESDFAPGEALSRPRPADPRHRSRPAATGAPGNGGHLLRFARG